MSADERKQIPWDLIAHAGFDPNASVGSNSDSSSAGDREEAEEARKAEENTVLGASKVAEKTLNPEGSLFQKLGFSQKIKLLINSTISQDHTGGLDQSQDALLVSLAQRLLKLQAISFLNPSQRKEQDTEEKSAWTMEDLNGANFRKLFQENLNTMSRRSRESPPDWFGPPPSTVVTESVVERATRRPIYQAPPVSYGDTGRHPAGRYSPGLPIPLPPMLPARDADGASERSGPFYDDLSGSESDYEVGRAMAGRQKPPLLNHATLEDEFEEPALTEEMNKYLEQALKATDEELRKAQRASSNMTSQEKSNMAESELDPITYYFACLKNKAQPSQGIEYAVKSSIIHTPKESRARSTPTPRLPLQLRMCTYACLFTPPFLHPQYLVWKVTGTCKHDPENLENPGKGKFPSEVSDEAVFSKKLEDLRSLLTPEEQLKILEAALGRSSISESVGPSSPLCGKDDLQVAQHSWIGTFGPSTTQPRSLSASTKASSYPEAAREADHSSTTSISMLPQMKPTSECGSSTRGTRKGNPRSSLPRPTVRQVKSPSLTVELLQNTGRERCNRGSSITSMGERSNKKANADSPSSQIPVSRSIGQPMGGKMARNSSTLPPNLREDKAAVENPEPRAKSSSPISHSEQAEDLCQDRDQQKQASSQSPDLLIIRGLQQRIAKLQQENKRGPKYRVKEEEATRVQIIYEVYCLNRKAFSYFLDKPLEYDDHSDQTFHLHGQKPFPNDVDLFIERERGALSFLVYKKLRCCKPKRLEEDLPVEEDETPAVQESIRVTSEKLHKAYIFLRERYPNEMKYFPEFKVDSQISSPFLFYFSKRSFIMSLDDLPDEHLSQVRLFREHIETSFGDEFARVENLTSEGNITAQYLAYLFEPGTVVVEKKGDAYASYEQVDWPSRNTRPTRAHIRTTNADREESNAENSEDLLYIEGQYWHFDGEFSMNWHDLYIDYGDPKQRVKPINELVSLPLRFAGLEVVEELRRRGSIFWSCRVRRFVSYNIDNNLAEEKQKSDSRYMVDLRTYQKMHQKGQPIRQKFEYANDQKLSQEKMDAEDPPEGNFIFLLPRTVLGFNTQAKQWVELQVDRISDVKWNKAAFESLVVDPPVKELITALVTNQLANERATDLMEGKGTGTAAIFRLGSLLLTDIAKPFHSGPGTGKTLTAERYAEKHVIPKSILLTGIHSVAEFAEKPLYRVTCGDIGTNAKQVEEYLKTILLLGKTWQCVVLLDEADVFLEQRSLHDLQRNALVSVFLRVLEYYDGILILTSNRVGTFDEAFESRIQLALHYKNLELWQRHSIWENFINRLEGFSTTHLTGTLTKPKRQDSFLSTSKAANRDLGTDTGDLKKHLDDLAKEEMNGRQIRNAITTARQLAMYKEVQMNYGHLKHVIKVAGEFDRYLFQLHEEVDDNDIMRFDGVR
ncbi:hypothetical protein HYFRA_00005323 [Hymenoscyphus fraxineus]|uniref:AAA+ ATPase domain-containing protein n=1 Tax=Hymenoscyphus fraxineus TaxID=746836 RepID=A0A9N9LD06_9HELO|nr:hypothetical protein HYFRA_00005323 [Hymenoscyphus fraxineus]